MDENTAYCEILGNFLNSYRTAKKDGKVPAGEIYRPVTRVESGFIHLYCETADSSQLKAVPEVKIPMNPDATRAANELLLLIAAIADQVASVRGQEKLDVKNSSGGGSMWNNPGEALNDLVILLASLFIGYVLIKTDWKFVSWYWYPILTVGLGFFGYAAWHSFDEPETVTVEAAATPVEPVAPKEATVNQSTAAETKTEKPIEEPKAPEAK